MNKPLFMLAPMLAFIPAMIAWAVIPFGAPLQTRVGHRSSMVVADLPVGFLFVLAISSLGVYGIVLAGWASNNKYALLGGLRSSAQMVSYEIAMGMSLIPVLLLAGNVTLSQIVNQQAYDAPLERALADAVVLHLSSWRRSPRRTGCRSICRRRSRSSSPGITPSTAR